MARKNPEIAEIESRFGFHPATEVTGPQHDAVRADLRRVALKFQKTLPEGRHKAMALTKLQEAMWAANAAIACDTRPEVPVGNSPVESSAAPADQPEKARRVSRRAAR
jgi:hypothetical protein